MIIDNSGRLWTAEDDRMLVLLLEQGDSAGLISCKICHTETAIRLRAEELGLLIPAGNLASFG